MILVMNYLQHCEIVIPFCPSIDARLNKLSIFRNVRYLLKWIRIQWLYRNRIIYFSKVISQNVFVIVGRVSQAFCNFLHDSSFSPLFYKKMWDIMIYVQMSTLRHAFLSFGYDKTIRYFVKSLLCQDFYHTPIPKKYCNKRRAKSFPFQIHDFLLDKNGTTSFSSKKMTGN